MFETILVFSLSYFIVGIFVGVRFANSRWWKELK
jgi:hypothetical protein